MTRGRHAAASAIAADRRVFRAGQADASTAYLLVHGVGLSHRSFTPLARELADTSAVVAIDLAGFAGLPHPDRRVEIEEYAAVVGGVADTLENDRVIVVGHSMGAQIALGAATLPQSRIDAVAMIGPVVDPRRPSLPALGLRLLRDYLGEPPRTSLRAAADALQCGLPWYSTESSAMRDYETDAAIWDLTTPLIVIRGEGDPIARADWCEWLAVAGGGSVDTVAGGRHNVVHSAPSAVAGALERLAVRVASGPRRMPGAGAS